jgi:hypothetical protein
VPVRRVTLPVAAGRNLAVLLEAAVRATVLKLRGIDSMQEFVERQEAALRADSGGNRSTRAIRALMRHGHAPSNKPRRYTMNKMIAVALSTLFAAGVALAQPRREAPKPPSPRCCPAAAARQGPLPPLLPRSPAKPLRPPSSAAAGDCEAKAVSKDGKPLAGAAKAAFIKKCEGAGKPADAKSGCAKPRP